VEVEYCFLPKASEYILYHSWGLSCLGVKEQTLFFFFVRWKLVGERRPLLLKADEFVQVLLLLLLPIMLNWLTVHGFKLIFQMEKNFLSKYDFSREVMTTQARSRHLIRIICLRGNRFAASLSAERLYFFRLWRRRRRRCRSRRRRRRSRRRSRPRWCVLYSAKRDRWILFCLILPSHHSHRLHLKDMYYNIVRGSSHYAKMSSKLQLSPGSSLGTLSQKIKQCFSNKEFNSLGNHNINNLNDS